MDIDFESIEERAEELVRSRTFLIAIGFFIAAFAVRWMFAQHGFWIDEGRALMTAKNFLQGNGFVFSHEDVMFKHPFVFYTLIAFSYLFFGIKAVAGMVVTNVLASLTVVLVFLTGRELFNDWAGAAAGVLMTFLPIHMFYSTRVLTDVPGTFFVVLTLYFWARTEKRGERWSFYAIFVSGALTILTKMTGIAVLPALFVYYLWKEREQMFLQRKYWYGAATTIGLYSIWEIRNMLTLGFLGIVKTFFGSYLDTAIGGGSAQSTSFFEGIFFHLSQTPNTLTIPGLLLFITGILLAYVYRDGRFRVPAVYLAITFLVLSSKGLNRYMMPLFPMAIIVAGYGADRLRELAASQEERAGHVIFILILAVSAFFMFQSGAAMVNSSAQGFTGLQEAGEWIEENSAKGAKVVAGSGHQIRFFSDRWTRHAAKYESLSDFQLALVENDIAFVEADRWESTQPEWFLQYVRKSNALRPVKAVERQGNAVVVVYQVNRSALEG